MYLEENVEITSIKELEYYLERWLTAYESGQPLVSDECYDHYKRQLEIHNPDSKFLQKIGNKPKHNKETLPFILGSLKNKTMDDLDQWLDKFSNPNCYILSHKMDGVAILCEYTNYQFTNAWLRGDHVVGENITYKAQNFVPRNLTPMKLYQDKIYLKGEILLNCEPAQIGYKNKRNAVAGILNRDDNLNLDKLYVIFHTWANPTEVNNNDEIARLIIMQSLLLNNGKVVKYMVIKNRSDIVAAAKKLIEEPTQYDKDGIVITIGNSIVENVKIPEYKIALKFNKQTAETTVEKIEWNTSRTGKVVPLVYIKSVNLGGATISKCAGFNAKYILENKLGPGSKIKIVRSGDVIPYIEQVITESESVSIIKICPSCNSTLEWDETKINLICKNVNCPVQVQKKIAHFFEQLGLEQFSEKMIASLGCESIQDVLNITKEEILTIEGWGEKSATDFINRINDLKTVKPEKLLAALSIENLGNSVAKLLLENFTFKEIISGVYPEVKREFIEKMVQIKGIGKKKVKSIVMGLVQNIPLLQQLQQIGVTIKQEKHGVLKGKSFCITGALSKPRKDIEKWIEDNGGVNTSINNCDYLICNKSSDSAKYKKALQRKIPIITEQELYNLN